MTLKLLVLVLIVLLLIVFNLIKFSYSCLENFENKKDNKILLLIFSCKKYESRIETLRKIGYLKYLEEKNVDYLVVTGDENLPTDYDLDLKSNKLIVKEKDTYEGLPYKVIKTFYTIVDSDLLNYQHVIKSDDDCLVNIDRINNNFNKIDGEDYVGLLNNFKETYNPNWNGLKNRSKYLGPYMNGGTGYILSYKALESIYDSKKSNTILLRNELYEDKLIGDILRLNGYIFKKYKIWNSIPQETNKINNYQDFLKKNNNQNITTFYGPQ